MKMAASQMALEDIGLFRSLPGSTVFYPSDAVSCEKLVNECGKLDGIKYVRTSRPKTAVLYKKSEKFPIGEYKILKQSKTDKAVLIGSGLTVHEALKAHHAMKALKI